jgi:hypothetical protein
MVLAPLAGATLCVAGLGLAVNELERDRISIRQPSSHRFSGNLTSSGRLVGRSNDALSGTIQGYLSGTGSGRLSGDLTGYVNGQIYGNAASISGSLDGRTRGDFSGSTSSNLDGRITGQMSSNTLTQFSGSTESVGTLSGDITPDYLYAPTTSFDPPGTPWLRLCTVLLIAAALCYLWRFLLIARRKQSALASTALVAKLTAAGGLAFFMGADGAYRSYVFGLLLLAYAGAGYLAYNHWTRVRAQLYRT